jgi:ribonucleoside-diphosphate reductase beta chain
VLAGYAHLLAAGRRLQWDAEAIDLSGDRAVFGRLPSAAQGRVRGLLAGFWVAEHQVAAELAPFLAASDGDARACFELQSADERRHARFFTRVLSEVLCVRGDARSLARAEIVALFDGELATIAAGLAAGEVGLGEAVGLYHLVLEAIVLAVGEEGLVAEAASLGLTGVAEGAARVRADERWHVGLGVLLLSALGSVPAGIEPLAQRAATAWGPEIATPERVERALAAHRRRLALLRREAEAAAAQSVSAPPWMSPGSGQTTHSSMAATTASMKEIASSTSVRSIG